LVLWIASVFVVRDFQSVLYYQGAATLFLIFLCIKNMITRKLRFLGWFVCAEFITAAGIFFYFSKLHINNHIQFWDLYHFTLGLSVIIAYQGIKRQTDPYISCKKETPIG
ncbi:MAG TPA: hypothetical protein VF857_03070, partial [Spirochaetota bacterium]